MRVAAPKPAADRQHTAKVEDRLQFANTVMSTTLEASPDAILVVDDNARIISFNRRFADMWNLDVAALTAGDDGPILSAVTSKMKDPEAFVARVRYLYGHPEEVVSEELETADGRIIERHTAVMRTDEGRYLGRVWFFRDITARKRAEEAIRRTARQDMLTGLANRRVFTEAIEQALARARRGEHDFAVFYLDLDNFKDVNDTLGHPAGDALLREVADRLRANVRNTDLVARFGGDEFAVLGAVVDNREDAASLAAKLVAAVGQPVAIAGTDVRCSVSIGVAVCDRGDADPELLLSQADLALYQAKADGRAGYRIFTESMATEVRDRVAVTADLRAAIAGEEFFLDYQPQFDAVSGQVVGVEALVRWRHPKRGVLAPAEFIPVAEHSGLIVAIDRWVKREACRQAAVWLASGVPPVAVSVNVSGAQFRRPLELEKNIGNVLRATGIPASHLELELTESALMAASGEHNGVLDRLRQSGVRVAIDDFGVGYSSLDHLRRFPVDRIKIAQTFVAQIATDQGAATIVRAIVALARELGTVAIAEGVETAEQFDLLSEWGCPQFQGYYFSRPLGAADVEALLRRTGAVGPEALADLSAA